MAASAKLRERGSVTADFTVSSDVTKVGQPTHAIRKYRFIDALRGYAVLFVITSHTGGMFALLPYPLKKLTNAGWNGVQLFFMISCVTLMMSWRADELKGIASAGRFWIRRFFRIAPMYYLAAVFYLCVEPPPGGFDAIQLLTSLAFVNAWHPLLTPTVPTRWTVVPGGWSISVEFTYYFLFPLIVTSIRNGRVAFFFLVFSIAFACIANTAASTALLSHYGPLSTNEFIYFWLPNQLPVFALGTILFFAIDHARRTQTGFVAAFTLMPRLNIALCALTLVILAENPAWLWPNFSASPIALTPMLFAVSTILMAFAATLALTPDTILVNKAICALGEVSFSAYLMHFFVLHKFVQIVPMLDVHRQGVGAIVSVAVLWCMAVPVTFALSKVTYELVEKPMIILGSRLAGMVGKKKVS